MSSLVELLGPFATTRNESKWIGPSMATGMAAMLWSRITVVDGIANLNETPALQWRFSKLSYEDVGLIYLASDIAVYVRPTLRKSGLLYCVLAIQPLLLVLILALTLMFHSTPMDKGFGLVSILSGIDRGSLDVLAGAALSGELVKSVRLVMQPRQGSGERAVDYQCQALPSTERHMRNGRLNTNVICY